MPKETPKRSSAIQSSPYPPNPVSNAFNVNALSKIVLDQVMAALQEQQRNTIPDGSDDDNEEGPTDSLDISNPNSTLSSNDTSIEDNFNLSIATHQSIIDAAARKLKTLDGYLSRARSLRNFEGLDETYKLIAEWSSKKDRAEAAIEAETKQFKLEQARAEEKEKIAQQQKDKDFKNKGKTRSMQQIEGKTSYSYPTHPTVPYTPTPPTYPPCKQKGLSLSNGRARLSQASTDRVSPLRDILLHSGPWTPTLTQPTHPLLPLMNPSLSDSFRQTQPPYSHTPTQPITCRTHAHTPSRSFRGPRPRTT
jgi:hypothetical protein